MGNGSISSTLNPKPNTLNPKILNLLDKPRGNRLQQREASAIEISRPSGFRGLGFRVWGFRGLGVRGFGV